MVLLDIFLHVTVMYLRLLVGITLTKKKQESDENQLIIYLARTLFIQCGRFVTDELVSAEEAHLLLRIAKKGLAKGGGAGGASILGADTPFLFIEIGIRSVRYGTVFVWMWFSY